MKATPHKAPEATRRRILDAAFDEFYRNGFQGSSLNHIVEHAGTTKGALFHHFADKNALGYAVVEEVVAPMTKEEWFGPLADSDDPIRDLKQLLMRYSKEITTNGKLEQGCALNNLAQEMAPLDEGFRRRIERVFNEWREMLTSAFARGIRAGNVRKDVHPRQVAAFVVAVQSGIMGTAKNAQSTEILRQAGAAFFDYLDSLKP